MDAICRDCHRLIHGLGFRVQGLGLYPGGGSGMSWNHVIGASAAQIGAVLNQDEKGSECKL